MTEHFVQDDLVRILPAKKVKPELHDRIGVVTKWSPGDIYSVKIGNDMDMYVFFADEMEKAELDPYGHLNWCIGSEDDFWCFDYVADHKAKLMWIRATINSETGSFIQDAHTDWRKPIAFENAPDYAMSLSDDACQWLAEGGDPIEHDEEGWNQSIDWFCRCVLAEVEGKEMPSRRPFGRSKA